MSLQTKIIGLIFGILVLGVATSSFFLIRASVEDKKNFIFDLQTSNGLLLSKVIKKQIRLNSNLSLESMRAQLETFSGIAGMGVALYEHQSGGWQPINKLPDAPFPDQLKNPASLGLGSGVATSYYDRGYIVSFIPMTEAQSLVIFSKDEPIFHMISVYFQRTFPILLIVLLLSGIVGWLFSRKVTGPLEGLSRSAQALGEGRWDLQTPESSTMEIQQLSQAFLTLANQLKEREQELVAKERLSALGTFGAGIAHELKNPLNVISSYAQLIARNKATDEKTLKQVEVIRSEIARATRIINDLLSFARQKPLQLENFELRSLIDETVEKLKLSQNLEHQWEVNVDEGFQVKADRENLRQVFINLLDNAIQAYSDDAQGGKIRIDSGVVDKFAKIEITDFAGGIPSEVLSQIFEPFFTTKSVGKGTGLGLAFCKGVMQQHRGDLKVESQEGKTTFTLLIPL